jgi:protein-tyrosine-phosphatase
VVEAMREVVIDISNYVPKMMTHEMAQKVDSVITIHAE